MSTNGWELLSGINLNDLQFVKRYVNPANVNTLDSDGNSLLLLAAAKGHVEIIAILLDNGPELNRAGSAGTTALHQAASRGYTEIVKMLIGKGADLNIQDRDGDTPTHRALWSRQFPSVRILLKSGANPNIANKRGHTPLHAAAAKGSVEILQELIAQGSNLEAKDREEWTPLHTAIGQNMTNAAKILLQAGASVTTRNMNGDTALLTAIGKGNRELAELLIAKGADVTAANRDGLVPLHVLAIGPSLFSIAGVTATASEGPGDIMLAKLLIANGASPDAKDKDGETPIDLARRKERSQLAAFLESRSGVAIVTPSALPEIRKDQPLPPETVALSQQTPASSPQPTLPATTREQAGPVESVTWPLLPFVSPPQSADQRPSRKWWQFWKTRKLEAPSKPPELRMTRRKVIDCRAKGNGETTSLTFSPNGQFFASEVGRDICLVDLASSNIVTRLEVDWIPVTADPVIISPDSSCLISGGKSHGGLQVWSLPEGRLLHTSSGPLRTATISPDGRLLARGRGKAIELWDMRTMELLNSLNGHASEVQKLGFTPDLHFPQKS